MGIANNSVDITCGQGSLTVSAADTQANVGLRRSQEWFPTVSANFTEEQIHTRTQKRGGTLCGINVDTVSSQYRTSGSADVVSRASEIKNTEIKA